VALGFLAGCASVETQGVKVPDTATATPTHTLSVKEAAVPTPCPEAGYEWDELARLAASNLKEAQALLLDAEAVRHQTAVDTGWRNPQLKSGQHWGDEDAETSERTGAQPFSGSREWSDREVDGSMAGLRIYTANPFVNRWLRKRGSAEARAKEAEAKEAGYAIYCEVRSLCFEAAALDEELSLLEQKVRLREQACEIRREQTEAGVASALELIRAEMRLESLRAEIREKRARRLQFVRQIALLAGLPAGQVRLRPPDYARQVASNTLDEAVLTDLAFLRRPDLARVQLEKDAARYGVDAAKAGQIPWFEYVEGNYEVEHSESSSYERDLAGHDRTEKDETEWQIRVAMTLPVFNWLGDEVRLTRAQLAAAEMREQGLYDRIRREVCGVLEDYRTVRAERDRIAVECERLKSAMTARIDALANEPTVRREDVLEAREELIEYVRVCMKVERECLRQTHYLETVSGGSLPAAAP
jgi:outer membrane protein TolC